MQRIPRVIQNADCADEKDPRALPIVSAKDSVAGKAPVVTAVVIDGDRAVFDEAATHGRTPLEQRLTWVNSPEEVPNGRRIYNVWLFIKPDRNTRQYVYHGAVAVDMLVDEEAGVGYKRLGHHARMLGLAMKGTIDLSILDDAAKAKLREALNQHPEVLQNSSPELHEALGLRS